MLRIILWRELLDLSRDRKTLLAVVLLPLIGLPGVAFLSGALASTQTIKVVFVVEDSNAYNISRRLINDMNKIIYNYGYKMNITIRSNMPPSFSGYDLIVLVPRGFWRNLSDVNGVARVRVSVSVSESGNTALGALQSAINDLSHRISIARIQWLAEKAGLKVNPENIISPLRIKTMYHEVTGAPASPSMVVEAQTARLLQFAFLFVVDPAIIYMADSVVGEKERRTIERLLLAPISRRRMLAGKVLASFVLGMIASLVDVLGLLLFFYLAGVSLRVSLGLFLVWIFSSSLIILITSALVGAISARSSSTRSAQNASFLLLALAMAIYFSALLIDISRVSRTVSIMLQVVPYTHAALAVNQYAIGSLQESALHIAILLFFTIFSIIFAERAFNTEKLVSYVP